MSALGSEQPGPQHSVSRKCGRPGVHPEAVWELSAQLAPAAKNLGPSPEASGRSPQLNSLRFLIQISLGSNTTSPGPARGKRGFQAASREKSVCSGESSGLLQEPPGVCFGI